MEEKSMNRIELDFDEAAADGEVISEAAETEVEKVTETEDTVKAAETEAVSSETEGKDAAEGEPEASETDMAEGDATESETTEEPAEPQVKLAEVSVEQFYRNTNTYPTEGNGPIEASICPRCGYVLALKCPNCHSVCDRRAKYCSECGTKLPERERKMFVIAGGLFGF